MEYLIFSDSHGGYKGMFRVIEKNAKDIAGVLFLGDGMADIELAKTQFPTVNFIAVAGNCDISARYLSSEWREKLVELEGKRVLMLHGHTRGVKYGIEDAAAYAKKCGADVLLFGHTHEAFERQRDGMWIFNPGSASHPREGEPTFGRMTIRNGQILLSHGSIYGGAK